MGFIDVQKSNISKVTPLAVQPIQVLNVSATNIYELILQSLRLIFIHVPLKFSQERIFR